MGKYFNFGKSVDVVRSLFPEETKNITFVDTSKVEATDQIFDWMQDLSRKAKQDIRDVYGGTHAYIRALMESPACAACDMHSGRKVLIMNRNKLNAPDNDRIFDNPEKEDAWIFLHELAHLIMEGGISHTFGSHSSDRRTIEKMNHESNLHEHRADLLSAMIGLQAGLLDKKDVEHLSRFRAARFIEGDFIHMTSHALDRMILDIKGDLSENLCPRTLMGAVNDYTAAYAPGLEDLSASTDFIKDRLSTKNEETGVEKKIGIEDMLAACKEAPDESTAFYALARTFRYYMNTGKLDGHMSLAEKKDLRDAIREKSMAAGTDGILAVFKEDSPSSTAALQKVTY